jgi:hypothetical protein
MSLIKELGEGIGDALVKGLEKNVGPAAVGGIAAAQNTGLLFKFGRRSWTTIQKFKSPEGPLSWGFAMSASTTGLTLAALICNTASGILPFVNCKGAAIAIGTIGVGLGGFSDRMDNKTNVDFF